MSDSVTDSTGFSRGFSAILYALLRVERAIRPIVTYRKVSGGSRSDRGARDFARVYSVLESRRKKGKLPFRTDPG